MSEVTRPAAASSRGGRGSGRGGRAGFGARSGHGKAADDQNGSIESDNDGQLGALRKKHGHKLTILQEMFDGWSDSDLLSALEEADGDEGRVAELISEGAIEQWHEVQKEVHRPKKEQSTEASNGRPARGGRGAAEGLRGRGKNTERGGARAPRGRSQNATTNGARFKDNQQLSVPTEESNGWGSTDNTASAWGAVDNSTSTWGSQDTPEKPTPAPQSAPQSVPEAAAPAPEPTAAPAAPPKQTWASMLRKSTEPPKPAPKPKEASEPKPEEPIEPLPPAPVELAVPEPEVEAPAPEPEPVQPEPEPVEVEAQPEPEPEPQVEETPTPAIIEPEIALPPPKDQLTQSNLEQVLDVSVPIETETAASTAADSWDPRGISASVAATPLSVAQGQQPPKPSATPSSGYATSALKATTERVLRTPNFARRVLDQEEAVRMPGNREVDGAAVQFGAFNLGDDADADDDAEDHHGEPAETRAQPPADSPITHPRTALPPAQPAAASVPDAFGAQKPASALPTPSAPAAAPTGPSAATAPIVPSGPAAHQHAAAPTAPAQHPQQFDRFAPPTAAHDAYQKPFGAFGQQTPSTIAATHQQQPHQPPIDAYPHQQSQAQVQPNLAATSGPSDYSSYATADPHNRNNYLYSGYYNNNNNFHHQGQQQQDSLGSQGRGGFGGAFNASQESMGAQYPQSGLHSQSRFGVAGGEAQNSGHTTPNPTVQNQAPGQQGHQPPQQGGQGSQHQPHAQGGYPGYNHPYMQSQYYAAYGFPYGGYGGPYAKGYGHPYGGPAGHFEHSSNPAPGFGQAAAHRNEAGPGSGLESYGRVGAQGGSQPGIGGGMGAFGSSHDTFRSGSYQSQGQGFGGSQPAAGAPSNDDLKPFADAKPGHSPAIAGVRPTSAANNAGQAGLPPPANAGQGQMGAFGGYPGGHLGHLQQSYGMGGNAGNNQQGSTPYGGNGYQGGYNGGTGGYSGYGNQAHGHRVGSGWGSNYS